MIVKDEESVIKRCLSSVKPFIDYWVIIDTGSTDGTQKVIQDFMKDVPGKLYEKQWADFAHNRKEALSLSKGKGDYYLLIDADEELIYDANYQLPNLDKDLYFCEVHQFKMTFKRPMLLKAGLNWSYEGVLHEELICPEAKTSGILENVYNSAGPRDGNRSKNPNKYQDDIAVLKKGLEKEPNNSRYAFYIAQCYRNLKDDQNAANWYKKRIQMGGGSTFETYWSLYCYASHLERLGADPEKVVQSYVRAHQFAPHRVDALYNLAGFYFRQGKYFLSYSLAKYGITIPEPKSDPGFTDPRIYTYGMRYCLANSAFKLRKFEEAEKLYTEILSIKDLEGSMREEVEYNLQVAIAYTSKNSSL